MRQKQNRNGQSVRMVEEEIGDDQPIVFDEFTIYAFESGDKQDVQEVGYQHESSLIRKSGEIEGTPLTSLLDCRPSTNLI